MALASDALRNILSDITHGIINTCDVVNLGVGTVTAALGLAGIDADIGGLSGSDVGPLRKWTQDRTEAPNPPTDEQDEPISRNKAKQAANKNEPFSRFAQNPDIVNKIPRGWQDAPTSRGHGWRWWDPQNVSGNTVRIDLGNPVKELFQQVDHVVVNNNENGVGKGGEIYKGVTANAEIAHIPLSEWINWSAWNHP
ncbi:MAG: hypothetical protein ABI947_12615 [Chloroflexota bacterium]